MNYKINTDLIQEIMLKKGYSITELSKISNVSKSTISIILKDQSTPRPYTLLKLSKALDTEIINLIKNG